MLRKKGYIAKQKIRFKRWSNRGCAVLLSLKHEVSIAILAGPLADAIGRKSSPLLLVSPEGVTLPLFTEPADKNTVALSAIVAEPQTIAEPARSAGYSIVRHCPFGIYFRNGLFYACARKLLWRQMLTRPVWAYIFTYVTRAEKKSARWRPIDRG